MLCRSMTDTPPDSPLKPVRRKSEYARPSDRIFRRSRAAKARRQAAAKSDFKFIALILQLSVLVALALIALGVMAQKDLTGGGLNMSGMAGLATPWLGPFSKLEVGGMGLMALILAGVYLRWTMRRK